MRKLVLWLSVLSLSAVAYEYETEETVAVSCSLSLSLQVKQAAEKDAAGEAVVTARLLDRSGKPIAGREIAMNSSWGTFLCSDPQQGSNSEAETDRSCFTTGDNGEVKVHLINLPFNQSVQVKAASECGDYEVHASGSIGITRKVIKKKK